MTQCFCIIKKLKQRGLLHSWRVKSSKTNFLPLAPRGTMGPDPYRVKPVLHSKVWESCYLYFDFTVSRKHNYLKSHRIWAATHRSNRWPPGRWPRPRWHPGPPSSSAATPPSWSRRMRCPIRWRRNPLDTGSPEGLGWQRLAPGRRKSRLGRWVACDRNKLGRLI